MWSRWAWGAAPQRLEPPQACSEKQRVEAADLRGWFRPASGAFTVYVYGVNPSPTQEKP